MKRLLIVVPIVFLSVIVVAKKKEKIVETEKVSPARIVFTNYSVKTFALDKISFLTTKQKDQHYSLYKGYVNKLNEIRQKMGDSSRSPGITYSEYRGLKIAETFALNGAILHELYFENIIDGTETKPSQSFIAKIEESFGSLENALKDLRDCTACSRGWAIMAYSLLDDHLYNFVLDAHNETVPVMVVPLIVLDVYEHAYMIDFGIDRSSYLDTLFKAFNWKIIEKRYTLLIQEKLKK